MAFCNSCGQPLMRRWLEAEARERDVCGSCHTVHYENPKVLVACFIHWRDRIVLCRRAEDPGKGCWYPPIGYVEAGETLEEAAARELQEEVGLAVPASRMRLYDVASLPHINQIYVGYRAELTSAPRLTPGKEALEVGLFTESELSLRQLAFQDTAGEVLRTFFCRLRSGVFPIRSVTLRPQASARGVASDCPRASEVLINADRR
jgi:ADP-ribose pyrophosphatase YjhB (NUDIX family)